jgi:hypothetical protein
MAVPSGAAAVFLTQYFRVRLTAIVSSRVSAAPIVTAPKRSCFEGGRLIMVRLHAAMLK